MSRNLKSVKSALLRLALRFRSRSMIKGRAFMVYWSFKGNPPPPEAPPIERVKELWRVVWRFFPDTRWNRMFFIVDSKYHFTPERSPGEPGEMP